MRVHEMRVESFAVATTKISAAGKKCSRDIPRVSVQGPGPFYGASTYRSDYPRRDLQPLHRHRPDKYRAPTRPMDTVPLYRESYVAHCARPARTCHPPAAPPVAAPLADSTEQRDRFTGDAIDPCPAVPLLQRFPGCAVPPPPVDGSAPERRWDRIGSGRFRFSDRDDVGHEWYTWEETYRPGPADIVYNADRYVRGDTLEATRGRMAADRAVNWAGPTRPTSLPVGA